MTDKAPRVQLIKRAGKGTRGAAGVVTAITDAGLEQVERDAKNGLANATIAKRLGLDRHTFVELCRRDDRLNEALERGRGGLADEVTDLLLAKARKGDVVAMIFLAKAKCGWRDQGPETATPAITNNIQIGVLMTTPERQQRIEQLLAERSRLLAAGNDGSEG